LPRIDGRITDGIADPPGKADRLHTERLIRLDGSFLCYRPIDDAGPIGPLPARQAGYITFGSFNNRAKLSPRTIATPRPKPAIAMPSRPLRALPRP